MEWLCIGISPSLKDGDTMGGANMASTEAGFVRQGQLLYLSNNCLSLQSSKYVLHLTMYMHV